jgi:hypothetical protein
MSSFRVRPRFKHQLRGDQKKWEESIVEASRNREQLIVSHLPGHVYIKIHPNHRHFWSPQLHLTFEQEKEQVWVRGLYGPNPTLWAVFFFGYVSLGLTFLFIGMWGLTRWSLGMSYGVLWVLPVLLLLALGLYLSAQTGQKLGAQQMFDIHHFFEEVTQGSVRIH